MATFTSIPHTTSFSFRHYDPSSVKHTQSKSKAKVAGHTFDRDRTEGATHPLESLHQDSEGGIRAVPLRVQAADHVEDVEDMDSTMYDLFGASHRKSMYDLASGDDHYQFGSELLDEESMDYATRVATLDSATNRSLDGSSRDFYSIGEEDAAREHHSAMHVQPSNRTSDCRDKSYHLTAANEGGHVRKHGDLDAAVEHTFLVGDIESPCHERSPAEDRTFGIVSVTDELSATRKRSRQFPIIDATITPLAVVPTVIPDLEPEAPYPAKRQKLAERQDQSPILEPAPAPKLSPRLDLGSQASRSRISDSPIPGPLGAAREGDGGVSRVLPQADLRDEEDDDDAYVQGTVEELLQARSSITPSEGMEGEQDVSWDFNRREMNRQGSGSKGGRTFEEELNHNNETYSVPPATSRRSRRRNCAPVRGPGLSDTAARPQDCNTVLTRVKQQARSSQPQRKSTLGRPKTNKGPQSCSPRSSTPDKIASNGRNINYKSSQDISGQVSGLALYPVPKGSSIVTATVRHCDFNWSLNPVTFGRKVLGKQVTVIRMTRLHASWELLGYQCNDGAPRLYDSECLNGEWINGSHSDAASYTTDHSDNDCDGKSDFEEQDIEQNSQRTHVAWRESDELRLLSYKDDQGMGWEEIYELFPGRTKGAVKARYYMLHKK